MASEVKHTPGPWGFRFFANQAADLAEMKRFGMEPVRMLTNEGQVALMSYADPDNPERVALVDCQTQFKRGQGYKTECATRDANARLIAAAPDLLAALKRLDDEGLLQTLIDMDAAREDDEPPVAEEALKAARAAISKATGEA